MPGTAGCTLYTKGVDCTPWYSTTTLVVGRPATSYGTSTLV